MKSYVFRVLICSIFFLLSTVYAGQQHQTLTESILVAYQANTAAGRRGSLNSSPVSITSIEEKTPGTTPFVSPALLACNQKSVGDAFVLDPKNESFLSERTYSNESFFYELPSRGSLSLPSTVSVESLNVSQCSPDSLNASQNSPRGLQEHGNGTPDRYTSGSPKTGGKKAHGNYTPERRTPASPKTR